LQKERETLTQRVTELQQSIENIQHLTVLDVADFVRDIFTYQSTSIYLFMVNSISKMCLL